MRGRVAVPLLAAAAWIVVPLAWIASDPRSQQLAFGEFSAHDRTAEGLSQAAAYLTATGRNVRLVHAPLLHAELPKNATIFRMAPRVQAADVTRRLAEEEGRKPPRKDDAPAAKEGGEKPSKEARAGEGVDAIEARRRALERARAEVPLLRPAELAWIAAGRRVVIGLDETFGGVAVDGQPSAGPVEKVHPSWPGVAALIPVPRRVLSGDFLERGVAIFAQGESSLVHRVPHGRGEIVLLSCPEVLRNDSLAEADHLPFLEALVGSSRTIVFDESLRAGTTPGALELLRRWGLGPFLALAAAAAGFAAWRAKVRLGPPADPWRDTRSEAVDAVDSLARLHARALGRSEALALHHRALVQEAARRTGLRGEALDDLALELLDGRRLPSADAGGRLGAAELERGIAVVNEGFRKLSARRISPGPRRAVPERGRNPW